MTAETTDNRVKELIVEQTAATGNKISLESLKPETLLQRDLNLDSLDNVEIGLVIYDVFGIDVAQEPLDWMTVEDVCAFVRKHAK